MEEEKGFSVFKNHPRGSWYLIAMVMWEFFSYYGMRSLLVLYLSKQLNFSDDHAYSLFGAYTALVFLLPTICGYIADRYIGYKYAAVMGGCLIAIGHFILALNFFWTLYIGLACLVVGVGFFKTNSISLLGEFYGEDRLHRQSAFNLYYAGGNFGGFIAAIACGYVAIHFGWHYGFILAGLGMVVGLLIMLSGRREFIGKGEHKLISGESSHIAFTLPAGLILGIVCISLVLYFLLAGYLLLVITGATLVYVVQVTRRCEVSVRRELYLFYVLTICSLVFWSFDNQGSSSVMLFLYRNIDRHIGSYEVATPMFQAVNPLVILFAAPLISFVWQWLGHRKIYVTTIFKFICAFILLTAGFTLYSIGAEHALTEKASLWWVIGGMALIGSAEVFVDPVALAFVSRVAPEGTTSVLTATYYLFCGALGNYVAAEIAKFTTIDEHKISTMHDYAVGYESVFTKIVLISAFFLLLLVLFRIIFRKLSVK
ncbi:MAG: oligopeptide:H+ symporter [Simkaniaceae bacterium]|nr:oligopeptide:H+ symporter [Simkaniaceae bacterium]